MNLTRQIILTTSFCTQNWKQRTTFKSFQNRLTEASRFSFCQRLACKTKSDVSSWKENLNAISIAYTATKVVFESAEGVSQSDRSKLAVQVQTIDVKMLDPASQNLKVFFILRHTQLDQINRFLSINNIFPNESWNKIEISSI